MSPPQAVLVEQLQDLSFLGPRIRTGAPPALHVLRTDAHIGGVLLRPLWVGPNGSCSGENTSFVSNWRKISCRYSALHYT